MLETKKPPAIDEADGFLLTDLRTGLPELADKFIYSGNPVLVSYGFEILKLLVVGGNCCTFYDLYSISMVSLNKIPPPERSARTFIVPCFFSDMAL